MRAMQHDDVVDDFAALGEFEGKDAVGAFFSELFTAVPDMEFTINRIVGGNDRIAVGEWSFTGTFSGGPFQGLEPTGRHMELRGVDVMEFEEGRLRRNTIYYDGLGFARQVGKSSTEDAPRNVAAQYLGTDRDCRISGADGCAITPETVSDVRRGRGFPNTSSLPGMALHTADLALLFIADVNHVA